MKLLVDIKGIKKKTCGTCDFVGGFDDVIACCVLFTQKTGKKEFAELQYNADGHPLRCRQCLTAERKAKGE